MAETPKSLDEIYASFQNLDKLYDKESRDAMDKELLALPEEERNRLKLQFDKLDLACKNLLG